MRKFKVLRPFRDLDKAKAVKKNDVIQLTNERAEELEANLKKHEKDGGKFFEEVQEKKPEPKVKAEPVKQKTQTKEIKKVTKKEGV